MFTWDEPMNPHATEDFSKAVREAAEGFNEELGKLGKAFREKYENLPMTDDDEWEHTEDYGVMHLDYNGGCGGWDDVVHLLLLHGYEVKARVINDMIEIKYGAVV